MDWPLVFIHLFRRKGFLKLKNAGFLQIICESRWNFQIIEQKIVLSPKGLDCNWRTSLIFPLGVLSCRNYIKYADLTFTVL